EKSIAIALRRAATLPGYAVTHPPYRATCLLARRIETQVTQQHENVHGGVPSTVPRRAAPPAVGFLQREQPGARAHGGDTRALGRHLLRGRTGQVPHHLPADRRVTLEKPPNDRHGLYRDRRFDRGIGLVAFEREVL